MSTKADGGMSEWTVDGMTGVLVRSNANEPLGRVRSTLALDGRVLGGQARPAKASGYVPVAIGWTVTHTLVTHPRYAVMFDGCLAEADVAVALQRIAVVDWTERSLH